MNRWRVGVLALLGAMAIVSLAGQQPADYAAWNVPVRPGTKLDMVKRLYEERIITDLQRGWRLDAGDVARFSAKIPSTDLQDRTPLPQWYRAYLRDNFPTLPQAGRYQYPRSAVSMFEWALAHPNLEIPPPGPRAGTRPAARAVVVGTNINVTSLDERNSESFIAVDYAAPQFLVAASNNISGSGRQRQFSSSDGGASWRRTELPLAPGKAFHSDPALAVATDGTIWAATLGINSTQTNVAVEMYKSTDHGATWKYQATVSNKTNNDKEMIAIDAAPGSPFKDNIYVAWDIPSTTGGMRLVRSTDKGRTWSTPLTLSTDSAIGAHLATGSAGEVYVAWPDTTSRQLKLRRSDDGGATFGAVRVIATTTESYDIGIPAMCRRRVLIYLTLAVDRSPGTQKGSVYAAWIDREGSPEPGCAGTAGGNTNVYFSTSRDKGATWSAPVIVHGNPPNTDQFNQWMDVDPADGMLHVTFYDTRDDALRKKTHLYYTSSADGGKTWRKEIKVTSAPTDETASPADVGNQYGDYNGLVVYRGAAHPSWTDRRPLAPGGKEQIYTATVKKP
jgi:hypothetical protein